MRDYHDVHTNHNASVVVIEIEAENDHLAAANSHAAKKKHARKTHHANQTHSRDNSATLKHNRERHAEKQWFNAPRVKKRKADSERDFRCEVELILTNKALGHGYVDEPELFYNAGYDAGFSDGYVAANAVHHEEPDPKETMPWENMDLVMYLFDDAAKYIRRHERYAEKYEPEVELMRAALKNGVHKINHSSIPVIPDIIFSEDILYLLLGKDGYAYMQQQSLHHLVETVAYNLYALSEQPELHQYYLGLLQNRDANCE